MKTVFSDIKTIDGCYPIEKSEKGHFFWSNEKFMFEFNSEIQTGIIIELYSPTENNECVIFNENNEIIDKIKTLSHWNTYIIFLTIQLKRFFLV